jgi:hypothetical protein
MELESLEFMQMPDVDQSSYKLHVIKKSFLIHTRHIYFLLFF